MVNWRLCQIHFAFLIDQTAEENLQNSVFTMIMRERKKKETDNGSQKRD